MSANDERMRRWRLVLGGGAADGTKVDLSQTDVELDDTLAAVYDAPRGGDLSSSSPKVARWLGDVRRLFPTPVVKVLQRDAMERLGLRRLLLEPELLAEVEPDVHLVGTLLSLRGLIPDATKDTAREVVRRVVEELLKRIEGPTRQTVGGALDRSRRTSRPRPGDIDWGRTILANLKHYQPEYGTVIPERLVGYARSRRAALREVVLLVDQSGSMAASVIYAGVFSAVLASLPALRTQVVAFDTAVVDLTAELHDPVDLLFGMQLGGGTDIDRALGYAMSVITRPTETVLVLLSDLYEGGNRASMLRRTEALVASGVRMVALLALSDDGAPYYDHSLAGELATLGVPSFACTPDQFPDLMAAAVRGDDLAQWAASHDIVVARRSE